MKPLIIFLLLFSSSLANAAGIYKWVDEQGNIHFTQTPPNLEDTKRVGDTENDSESFLVTPVGICNTLDQLLIGDWRGKDKDQRIVFRFYRNSNWFTGKKSDKGYFIDYGKQGQLQGGFWVTRGPNIKFKIKKTGNASRKRPTIEDAMVAKIDYQNLILLVGEEEFRLIRYSGSGNLPRCSKNK